MTERPVWFLHITHQGRSGVGEVAPIRGLSPDILEDLFDELNRISVELLKVTVPTSLEAVFQLAKTLTSPAFPSVRFGLEMTLLDWLNGGKHHFFDNSFAHGKQTIPINGLVWMSGKTDMIRQIDEKLAAGYTCIKLKVGALDFEEELALLRHLRSLAPDVTIRLDANGAFETNEALARLKKLAEFDIHSIEQPIAPRQSVAMQLLIEKSPIPIALDEELIDVRGSAKGSFLDELKPSFIVLKPTLLGGFAETKEWIQLAESRNIGWWITSYLESNIGLNAIAQFTGNYPVELPQGLGTGALYSNNFDSPLAINYGQLGYRLDGKWDDPFS